MNLFVEATKKKYRFPTPKGNVYAEDLWDLSKSDLTKVYQTLKAEEKEAEDADLFESVSKDKDLSNRIEIIKYVAAARLEQERDALKAKEKAEKKEFIKGLIKEKQYDELKEKDQDELMRMLEEL